MSTKKMKFSNNFYLNSLFTFSNPSVFCSLETSVTNKKISKYQIKIQRDLDAKPIKFAYKSSNGLVRINCENGAIDESNILGEFLKIYKITSIEKRAHKYLEFFEKNGFLTIETSLIITIEELDLICERLSNILNLMLNIYQSKTRNYDLIEEDIEFLLAKGDVQSDFKRFTDQAIITYHREKLYDPIYNAYNVIEPNLLSDIVSNASAYDTLTSNSEFMTCLYSYYDNKNTNNVWFIYVSYIVNKYLNKFKNNDYKIDKPMKEALIKSAKAFYKEQIDYYIQNIKPVFSIEKDGPDWSIDSLLSALYLSIFYLNPKQEIYKECEYCGKPFLMRTTASNKKYCSIECANKATQARFRAKKKELAMH